jgi:hypothetical protein
MGKTFDDLLNELNDPTLRARDQEAKAFLDRTIFDGVTDIKPAYESPKIKHFDSTDFDIVIERCTHHNVLILAIEVFTHDGVLVTVEIASEQSCSNEWCLELMNRFRGRPNLSYCATYDCAEAVE